MELVGRRLGAIQTLDDFFDGAVSLVVCVFELAVRFVIGRRAVMKAAIGERSAEPFMEEQKQQSDVDALGGEAVGVAFAVALE